MNDELTMTPIVTSFSRRPGLGWVPVLLLLAPWIAGCFADSVVPGPYGAVEDDAAAAAAPPATTEPEATTLPDQTGAGDANLPGDKGGTPDAAAAAPTSPCDLSGRWIATDHQVTTGLGAQEATHIWYYLEMSQAGGAGTVTRGLDCGENVRGISSVAADVDYPKTWPALLAKVTETGRKFTSSMSGSGCAVSFDKFYQVVGATVSFYVDPNQTMPTSSQQAMGTTPGWEDWDDDGNPGFTTNVTGLATGQIYMATRRWTIWSGTVAASASTFQLADNWNTEQDVFGYNGSQLLSASTMATRDNDASLHFIQFARLSTTQATGDTTAICTAIRSLATSLTPDAANN